MESDRILTESQILTFSCHPKDEKESKLQGNKIIIPRPETDEELSLR